ncbi:MAG: hypothetical protein ACI9VR_003389 [Cognaticolwellia sp.]|jgi:hypothetical protein
MSRSVDPVLLPTLSGLYRATAGAVVVAVALIVTTVLPAEMGVDPTGVGTAFGLTAMGQLKQKAVASDDVVPDSTVTADYGPRSDETTFTLGPNQSTEFKAIMRKGDKLDYTWSTEGGELFYDFHGDPKGSGDFISYEKSTKASTEGTFEASFEGKHGWYWKNRNTVPVTVVLKTSGAYESIKEQR